MEKQFYVGEQYSIEPDSIRFDDTMVEFNRKQTDEEYETTKLSIGSSVGQVYPICINSKTGLCEDGRHRVRACKELQIPVKCIQVNDDYPKADRLAIYNLDSMSGRDLTPAQKAIQAYKYHKVSKEPLETCAKRFNVVKRHINAVNSIAGLGRQDVLDEIMQYGKWMKPDGKYTKDLRAIDAVLKQENEKLEDVTGFTPMIDYEGLLNTEKAKVDFWGLKVAMESSYHERMMILIHMLNYKYILKSDPETGEVFGEVEKHIPVKSDGLEAEDFIKAYIDSISKSKKQKYQLSDDEANRLVAERKAITNEFID